MACRTKPLSEPMLEYCWLDPWEQISVKSQSQFTYFHQWKCIWKRRQEFSGHFVSASMCSLRQLALYVDEHYIYEQICWEAVNPTTPVLIYLYF